MNKDNFSKNPLISVILTSYNQHEKLKRAFQSILSQTYSNIEIIVVDDASTDGQSQKLIKEWGKKYQDKVRCFFQPINVGIPKNKNTGFKLAKGDFITYLDGDDYYYPKKLENELQAFKINPSLDVVYSNFRIIEESSEKLWIANELKAPIGDIFEKVICREFPYNILFRFELMRNHVLQTINYYDESIPSYHDWDSRIRYSINTQIGYAPYIGSAYIQDPEGISKRTKFLNLQSELLWVFKKNKFLLFTYHDHHEAKRIYHQFIKNYQQPILSATLFHETPGLHLRYGFSSTKNLRFLLSKIYYSLKCLINN